jgi:hypothetical protein
VRYQIIDLDMGCLDACTSYLEIKSTSDFTPVGYRICCKPTSSTLLISATNEMLLLYRTDPAAFRRYKGWGFRLRYVIG